MKLRIADFFSEDVYGDEVFVFDKGKKIEITCSSRDYEVMTELTEDQVNSLIDWLAAWKEKTKTY